MCVFLTPFWSARLCVYIEGDKSEKSACVPARLSHGVGGAFHQSHRRCPRLCSCWHPSSKLPSHPKSHYIVLSPRVHPCLSLSSGGLCVLMYIFFIAKLSWSAADIKYRRGDGGGRGSVSLWSNMNILSVAVGGPILWIWSPQFCVYACMCETVWECFKMI